MAHFQLFGDAATEVRMRQNPQECNVAALDRAAVR